MTHRLYGLPTGPLPIPLSASRPLTFAHGKTLTLTAKVLACATKDLGLVQAGDARDGGDHHARQKLHGSDVALVEGSGRRRQNFEDPQRAAEVAQGRDENGADSEAAAAGKIDTRIALGVVAQHDLAGAYGFGGDAGIGLKADSEIGGGASSAGAADDFVAGAEGDGGSGGSGQMLGALGDGADRGLEVEFGGMDFDFFAGRDGAESGGRMRGIGHTQVGCAERATACGNDRRCRAIRGRAQCGASRARGYRVRCR